MSELQKLGEFGWIERQKRRLSQRAGVYVGIGDDGAVLEALCAPVVTCDCLVEGVHFRRDWSTPRQLGRKTMSVNVSDIAAMGARPVAAFIALALPATLDAAFLDEFYAGLEEIAERFCFTIAGGDTARTDSTFVINVTLIGETLIGQVLNGENSVQERAVTTKTGVSPSFQGTIPHGAILRSGAQIDDAILVTGTLGDARAGLEILLHPQPKIADETRRFLIQRHLDPTARLAEMRAALQIPPEKSNEIESTDFAQEENAAGQLDRNANENGAAFDVKRAFIGSPNSGAPADTDSEFLVDAARNSDENVGEETGVHAALDLSDGLAGDAAHIARASGVTLQIEIAKLPLSGALRHAAAFSIPAQTTSAQATSEKPDFAPADATNEFVAPNDEAANAKLVCMESALVETGKMALPRANSEIMNSILAPANSAFEVTMSTDRVLDLAVRWALSGGEDYELLLCVAPEKATQIARRIESATGTKVTQIGRCVASENSGEHRVQLLDENGAEIPAPAAWTHF